MTSLMQPVAPSTGPSQTIIGESEPMCRLRALIETVAPTRLAVLIQGPTGAGKELVAAALHDSSGRRGGFVPFNVCAIGDSMFEDALFGHVRGAFTGAVSEVPGYLSEANGGTAFFDEVSGLAPSMQAKLLRAMETGVFRPVGAKRDARSDFRMVAATNERVDVLVREGRMRMDFAQRVGAVTVHVPALVERMDDLPLLTRHFLDLAGRTHVAVGSDALGVLSAHDWPGNVRELRHVIEWAAAFSANQLSTSAIRAALDQRRFSACDSALGSEVLERRRLTQILDENGWNIELVAERLAVHRATLYRRMKRLGISSPLRRSW